MLLIINLYIFLCFIFLENFQFKETDLFHLLNSSLLGKIVLGKYRVSKEVDYHLLKEIVIVNILKDRSDSYK